jgi:hypothetical protein
VTCACTHLTEFVITSVQPDQPVIPGSQLVIIIAVAVVVGVAVAVLAASCRLCACCARVRASLGGIFSSSRTVKFGDADLPVDQPTVVVAPSYPSIPVAAPKGHDTYDQL